MSLDCNRLASPNPLLWLNLVGAGSSAIFLTVLGISTQPVLANQPEPQETPSESLAVAQPPTPTANQENPITQKQPLLSTELISQPDAINASVTTEHPTVVVTSTAFEPVLEGKQPEIEGIKENKEPQVTSQKQCDDKTCGLVNSSRANLTVAQLPYPPLAPAPIPVPAAPIPGGSSNSTLGQLPSLPQPQSAVPVPPPVGFNNYSPMAGQAYYPQMMMLVPVPAAGMPPQQGFGQMGGQAYYPQMMMLVPVPAAGMQPQQGFGQMGQPMGYPQMVQPLPPPLVPNQPGFTGYPQMGQPMGYPQMVQPLPPPLVPNQPGFTGYPQVPVAPTPGFSGYPQVGQQPYYPQVPVAPNPGINNFGQPVGQIYPQVPPTPGFSGYPQVGQPMGYPQVPVAPNPGINNFGQPVGQIYPQVPPNPGLNNFGQPVAPTNFAPPAPTPTVPQNQQQPLLRSTALTAPSLQLQGVYINQGDQSSARARLSALYPLTPQVQFGATLDLTSNANSFADSPGQGLNVNELYVAAAPFTGLPNLRFVVGQLDLTSYFDRNSFAKDGASQFFNPVFQTNPALSATGIASRPGALVNWTLTDNIEAKAAVFSSSRSLSDFSLDAFAGEIGFRYGNAIVRGTFTSDRDAGSNDGFGEIFGVRRADGGTGIRSSDRENSYGVNAEYFVPNLNMGLFARYGRYENQTLKLGGDTYSFGVSFLDVFSKDDRLGLAYGRNLSNNLLRQVARADVPDVLELFYDFRFLPNLRLGFTLQQRNGFEDTYAGFRVKTDFDLTPRGRLTP